MKIAITGCGRSGTTYAADVMQSVGVDVLHETDGKDGIADWRIVRLGVSNDYITFHQVRHPLRAIESLHTFSEWSWGFINAADRLIRSKNLTERCMQYWLYWNREAEKMAELTYQVEQMPEHLQTILEMSGREWLTVEVTVPTTVNTRRGMEGLPELGWQDLIDANAELAEQIFKLAEKYEY